MLKLDRIFIVAALAAAVLPLHDAFARGGRTQNQNQNQNQNPYQNQNPNQYPNQNPGNMRPNPQQNPAVIADQTEISTLQISLNKIGSQVTAASTKITSEFQKSPEYVDAQKQVDEISADTDKARAAVIDKLKTQPDYVAATTKEKDGQKKVNQLKADGGSKDAILSASTEVLKLGGVTSKMEKDALDADPTYQDCLKKRAELNPVLQGLKDALAQKLKDDPDIVTLRTSQTDTQTKLTDARKKLTTDLATASSQ